MEIFEKAEITSLQKSKNTESVEINDRLFIRQINPSVIIMPYTINSDNMPDQIGIISEILDQRPGGISMTLITGTPDDKDSNIFQTAIRELKEESGFLVEDIKRWNFLGTLYTSKMVVNSNPCFSVNITGLVAEEKTTDGSQSEKDSKFDLIDVEEALDLEDSLVSTLFLKTFKNVFIKKIKDNEPAE
jgi:8-oxo-dGTP pyrophosphatase MutT (NUDIX family)